METYLAVFGRQPALGLAELESIYGSDAVRPLGNGEAAILRGCPDEPSFARLGGSVKLGRVVNELEATAWPAVQRALADAALACAGQMPDGKIRLGLSTHGFDIAPAPLLAAGLSIKNTIRRHLDRNVQLVPNKTAALNAAQVIHHKLTGDTGCELLAVRDGTRTVIARTLHVQDIEQYGKRDFGRPRRDARVGMLPPKLAQIIINLATATRPPRQTTVLDPFCGTGVILQEALLAGFRTYGTDLEPRMIAYTRENMAWLQDIYQLAEIPCRLASGDATSFSWERPVDVVASETYLGRPFTTTPVPEVLAQTITGCNLILKKFLHNIHAQLSPGARLCLAVPAWQVAPGRFRHLPLIDRLADMGYNRVSLQHVRDEDLLYYRTDQIVARQLLIITRN